MIRRLLWLGVGVGIGVAVVRVVSKKLRPSNLATAAGESIGAVGGSIRGLFDDVIDNMHDREYEIRAAFTDGEALDGTTVPWARGVGGKFDQFKQQLEGE